MVTEIKIQSYSDDKKDWFVCRDFEKLIDRDLQDVLLYKKEEKEEEKGIRTAYIFVSEDLANAFIGILLKYSITVCSKKDFTSSLLDIMLDKNAEEFKSQLDPECNNDDVLKEFYENYIDTDMVLEKIYKHGIESLNKNDHDILKKASSY